MTLAPGSRLGPYEILSLLGAGGMGEVYRARDTQLDRTVAIKVLPAAVANDAERMARFQREAQVLASLNHPNIAAIYGLEESSGRRALVMELVEGPTLAERINSRPIELDEALPIAKQIAEGLEYAHERGIIHRDLKPANIKITPEGTVKVLDFGLAKALEGETASSAVSDSPTLSAMATQAGVILGTAAYMPPEQARGKIVDRRADIWAFGCALFEVLAAKRAFEGEAVSDVLAAVLRAEPDWARLPRTVPPAIVRLTRRCLEKDPKRRLQAIGEARIVIEETLGGNVEAGLSRQLEDGGVKPPLHPWRRVLPWALAAILLIATVVLVGAYLRLARAPISAMISQIQPPSEAGLDMSLASVAPPQLSPDGRRLVFLTSGPHAKPVLWLRPLDSIVAAPLEGTEDARAPFWSPNGRSIGFFAGGRLKKIEVSGGPPVNVCDASLGQGGTWALDGTIVFAPSGTSPLYRVLASGGQPVQVTFLDSSRKEASHSSPQFLPDNRHFLYYSVSASAEFSGMYIGSLKGGDPKLVLRGISKALYAPPGYLLFEQEGGLMARPFNPSRFEVSGESVVIARPSGAEFITTLSASQNGILAYIAGTADVGPQMEWFDSNGRPKGTVRDRRTYYTPRLSPDDTEIAVAVAPPGSPTRDIWVFDLARRTERRLTFDQLHNWTPVWSPDGTKLAYSSNPKGKFHIYERSADGSGTIQPLLEDDAIEYVDSWSSDGKYIAYAHADPGGKPGWDIWVLPLFGDRKPFPVVQSQFNKEDPSFSPNGKWLAYDSDESGTWEVYIVTFPRGEGKWQVSAGGARQPRWRRDGKKLFFLATGNKLMAAEVKEKNASLEIGSPQSLFQTNSALSPFRTYDVTRDGKRFVFVTQPAQSGAKAITLIANWQALLEKR